MFSTTGKEKLEKFTQILTVKGSFFHDFPKQKINKSINFPDDLKFTLGDYFLIHNDVYSTPTTRTTTEDLEPVTSQEPGTSQEGTAETGNGQETTVGPKIGTSKETTTEEPKIQGALVLSAVFLLMSFLSDPGSIIVFPCQ